MTARDLDEEKCRILIERLCSGLGWSVRQTQDKHYILLDQTGEWLTFGQSMTEIVEALCNESWLWIDGPDVIPSWLRECSSWEELMMKAEVAL